MINQGHEIEGKISHQLLMSHDFSWGIIKEIDSIGLVQKDRMPHVKASVDHLLCITDDSSDRNIFLSKYKAQIKPEKAQKEQDQIESLRNHKLMDDISIFTHITSNNDDSFDFIHGEEEQIQALHHAYTYGQKTYIHAVENTRSLLSCTKFDSTNDIMDAYCTMQNK